LDLDKIQIKASLRSGWQALDLGFLMARGWWWPLFVSAVIPATVAFIPLLIVCYEQPVWALFWIWWLKPFWERLPLYYASRRLFDDRPGHRETLANIWQLYGKDFLPWLLWRRFSLQRSFDMPVTVLEGLKSSKRGSRLRVLHGKYSDVALANQFLCACFEIIFTVGVIILISFFIPEQSGVDFIQSIDDYSLAGQWLYSLSGFIAILVIIPFHTMAGFALYLNRRIEIEAWDIEISFRNLFTRKQPKAHSALSTVLVVILGGWLLLATPQSVEATQQHGRESAKELIDNILQGEDFGKDRIERKWRFKNWAEENEDKIPDWMISFGDWLDNNLNMKPFAGMVSSSAAWFKIFLVVAFIALLFYLYRSGYRPFDVLFGRAPKKDKTEPAPEVMFGLDVTPQSLPEDVGAQVMLLWSSKQPREALSLLYRASLSRLIDKHQLAFRPSHTEAECAALVRASGMVSVSAYFSTLTQEWRRLAYGHLLPEATTVESLCAAWSKEFSDAEG
jgi:hypothetical protein